MKSTVMCTGFGERTINRRAAFTLPEILVVIGVIAALLGILLPVMRAIKLAGRQTVELNAAKHLMMGYLNYATVNNDKLLPGYASQIPYDANPELYPGDPTPRIVRAFDAKGNLIQGGGGLDIARRRYLWRLAPYLNYSLRGLYTNDQEEVLEKLEQSEYTNYLYTASISPSLGLNTEWLGGDENGFAFRMPRAEPPDGPGSMWSVLDYHKFYLVSLAQAFHPNRLLTFASARGVDPQPALGGPPKPVEGYFRVTSPYFSALNPTCRWADDFHPGQDPVQYGHISPRYDGSAVVGFLDGHTDLLDKYQIRDMRYWANWAEHENWTLPQPTTP
jgi:prepilin-type N-terminal cleavage/methylation domain-containing protein